MVELDIEPFQADSTGITVSQFIIPCYYIIFFCPQLWNIHSDIFSP